MVVENFISPLDGVKRTRHGWMAICPGHADKSPSLSIAEGDDGRILLRCFAGCTPQEITAAMGLTLKDLFADSNRSPDEIRRERERREKKRLKEEMKFKKEGARLDTLREAELFIRSAQNIPDSHTWSDAKRHRLLNQLADAYAILAEEEMA